MKIIYLPDLAAMAFLLLILYSLRRRHLQEGVGLWIVGLVFIFIEAIAHSLYNVSGPLHIPTHVIALDSYLAAGMIFLWAATQGLFPRRPTLTYLAASTLPLAILETVYAFDVRNPLLYQQIAGLGLLLGLATPVVLTGSLHLRRAWWLVLVQVVLWGSVWGFASNHLFRDTAYFPLFLLYLSVAVVFGMSLPRKSLGRLTILTSFTIWSLVFLVHAWVSNHPQFTEFTSSIWDWQKFFVTIGMVLVMLERQVASNEWYAHHDQLTGLPNRRLFEEKLEEALLKAHRTGTRIAIAMMDLDGFKAVNDSHGHEAGDHLLKHIAGGLRQAVRLTDTLARLGGDEFILVATGLPIDLPSDQIAKMVSERLHDTLRRPFHAGGMSYSIGASVGVAVYPDDATDEMHLRRLADLRMYQQKRQDKVPSLATDIAKHFNA